MNTIGVISGAIRTWRLGESENYDRFGTEGGRGWMARLAPVRDELLRGDLRSLCIGWLAALTGEMLYDNEMGPLAVRGLGSLTSAQEALAEFLEGEGRPRIPLNGDRAWPMMRPVATSLIFQKPMRFTRAESVFKKNLEHSWQNTCGERH